MNRLGAGSPDSRFLSDVAKTARNLRHRSPDRFRGPTGSRASSGNRELHAAEEELIGKGVVTTNGRAGTINHVYLDEAHGLRISISGHDGEWPISTVKFIES
jgi:hypothetical protein